MVSRVLFLVVLPVGIYIATFYAHLTLLTKAGHNDDIMTSAFQASLEVSRNILSNKMVLYNMVAKSRFYGKNEIYPFFAQIDFTKLR